MTKDVYYFYDGFTKPKVIDIDNLVLQHNYKGNMTDEFLEEHNQHKHESDRDYNELMFYDYRIFRKPTLEELQEANHYFGLDNRAYLDDFLKQTVA